MLSLTFRPLRNPVHMLDVPDKEIRWKLRDKKRSGRYLSQIPTGRYKELLAKALKNSTTHTEIVDDSRGKIENILLTIPPFYDPKNPKIPIDPYDERHLKTLLKHLSKHKRNYTIVCHSTQVEKIRYWFRNLKVPASSYKLCISVFNYSIWAQDAYVALNDKSRNMILCEGVCFTRDHDMSVANDLSTQTEIRAMMSHLYFQGGNILQVGEFVIVGLDYVMENSGRMFMETRNKVLKQFSDLLGKPVIGLGRADIIKQKHRQFLGGGIFQPIFHIDMYVSPTGKKNKQGKDIVLVGSPKMARKIIGEKEQENDYDLYFDEAADQLSGHFDVRRMPLLPTKFKTQNRQARYYYLTYNNAIVEVYREKGKEISGVYLPTYSQDIDRYKNETGMTHYYGDHKKYKKLDLAAKKIWESLGFKVYSMDGLESLAMSWGSVHCIAKTLLRSVEEPHKKTVSG